MSAWHVSIFERHTCQNCVINLTLIHLVRSDITDHDHNHDTIKCYKGAKFNNGTSGIVEATCPEGVTQCLKTSGGVAAGGIEGK